MALGLSASLAGASAEAPGRSIDPYAEEQFSCTGRPDGRLHNNPNEDAGYNGFRVRADLDVDGREDLILTTAGAEDGGCGNAGCTVAVFLQHHQAFLRLPQLLTLHPFAARFRKVRPGEGVLTLYHRMNASGGAEGQFRVSANALTPLQSVDVHVTEPGTSRPRGQDSDEVALRAEYAHCEAGQLKWRDTYE